eukprot:TRINITY_DN749_c0_g2_i2.p2 TRINITY_DN749_c0_g2~~TRINITY_DN749_c0_g2_i2.p2  ORF type:complete len:189 (+),score=41.54 TRINITY_DN749_c0_g2_i2:1509-2075(+)
MTVWGFPTFLERHPDAIPWSEPLTFPSWQSTHTGDESAAPQGMRLVYGRASTPRDPVRAPLQWVTLKANPPTAEGISLECHINVGSSATNSGTVVAAQPSPPPQRLPRASMQVRFSSEHIASLRVLEIAFVVTLWHSGSSVPLLQVDGQVRLGEYCTFKDVVDTPVPDDLHVRVDTISVGCAKTLETN